jgi:hypothetical protein
MIVSPSGGSIRRHAHRPTPKPECHALQVLDRRLGLKAVLAVVVVTVALVWGLTQLIGNDPDETAPVTASATPCKEAADPYGTAPDGFEYEQVDEATRAKTVKALNLDEAGGRVDMRAARRGGLTLGTLVGVPSKDPGAYAIGLVRTAERGGAPVTKRDGYAVIPLAGGSVVAVGVRGCRAILINAQDSTAVPFLADAVFGDA